MAIMGAILTTVGLSKLATATPLDPLTITHIAVGDGAGGYPTLNPNMTALTNERWRGTAKNPYKSEVDPTVLIFEGTVPSTSGGWVVREQALFDEDGDMIAIGHTSEVEKPLLINNVGVVLTVRLHMKLSNASEVDLIFQDFPINSHSNLGDRETANSHPAEAISYGVGTVKSELDNLQVQAPSGDAQILNGIIWPSDDSTLSAQINDTGLVDVKFLRDASNNKAYRLNKKASGTITALNFSERTATIGGVDLILSPLEAEGREILITDPMFNPPSTLPTYGEDWTSTINAADEYCFVNGYNLKWVAGQYCITSNIQWKSRWVSNYKAPELAPFPQLDDDKRFLRQGYKHLMAGVSIFAQTGTYQQVTTQRSDLFSTITPVIKTVEKYPVGLHGGMALIMDMDVLDVGGSLTSPVTDNRATGMDVGILVDDASSCDFDNFVVYGYYDKAGTVIWSHGSGDNPDYTKFGFGSTMGYYGLALLGNDTAAGNGEGLSGTQSYGLNLFGNDHHSRSPQILEAWQTNTYGHLLFIDGKTAAASANVNGHYFFGGGFRTYSKDPVVLDNASNLHLIGVPFEFPEIGTEADTLNTKFKATVNTFNVNISNSRNLSPSYWANSDFGDVITELNISSDTFGESFFGSLGQYVGILSTGGGGLPRIIFTNDPSSTENNYTIRRQAAGQLQIRKDGEVVFELDENGRTKIDQINTPIATITISGGAINVNNNSFVSVAGEGGVADTLTTINGGVAGDRVLLKSALSSVDITVQDQTGNIRLANDLDFILSSSLDKIELVYDGSFWSEISRANNG